MDSSTIGYLAGLSVSFLWTITSLLFTAAGKRIGTTVVNATRLSLALALHVAIHHMLTGYWLPELRMRQVLYLGTSGVLGLAIGDQAIIQAFVTIGPRLALLVMTTAPLLAALFGWIALAETLPMRAWLGIALTVGGVAWVILERSPPKLVPGTITHPSEGRLRGCLLALVASACQAFGLMLSKQGMGHGWLPREQHLPPQTATVVRLFFASAAILPILVYRNWRASQHAGDGPLLPDIAARRRAGFALACGGAVTGPLLGVWLSLVASDRVPIGVAQTLLSLPPVLILPLSYFLHKERVGLRAVVGAGMAVAGVIVLSA